MPEKQKYKSATPMKPHIAMYWPGQKTKNFSNENILQKRLDALPANKRSMSFRQKHLLALFFTIFLIRPWF